MPTGKVKWYDAEKGFGFLTRDSGGDVFVHQSALPVDVTSLRAGQRVEFGVAEGRRGEQALSVQLIERPVSVANQQRSQQRKKPDELVLIVEDLINLLDGVSGTLRRGHHPDAKVAKQVVTVLRGVADDLEP